MTSLAILAVGIAWVQAGFRPGRFVLKGEFSVHASVSRVFPMFEPVGEKQWAQGWDPQPIYPATMEAAEGTVFQTVGQKGGESIWTITKFERDKAIEYTVVTPGHDVTQVSVTCDGAGDQTHVTVIYRITGLTEKGNEFGAEHSRAFSEVMDHWKTHVSLALAHHG